MLICLNWLKFNAPLQQFQFNFLLLLLLILLLLLLYYYYYYYYHYHCYYYYHYYYLTSVITQIKDKTNHKSHSLQRGLFTANII